MGFSVYKKEYVDELTNLKEVDALLIQAIYKLDCRLYAENFTALLLLEEFGRITHDDVIALDNFLTQNNLYDVGLEFER